MNQSLASILTQLRHTGNRQGIRLERIEQMLQVEQLGQRLSQASHVEREKPSGQASPRKTYRKLPLPSKWSPPDSLEKTTAPANFSLQERLTDCCRIVTSHSGNQAVGFQILLQVLACDKWVTVASYEYANGRSRRYLHHINGNNRPFVMDLPPQVVSQMSREDFSRNWTTYYEEFLSCSERSIA